MDPSKPKPLKRNSNLTSDGGWRAGNISRCRRIWLRDTSTKRDIALASHCSSSWPRGSTDVCTQNRSISIIRRWMNFGSSDVRLLRVIAATKRAMAHWSSDKSAWTAIWWRIVSAEPWMSPPQPQLGSCVANSCTMKTTWRRSNFRISTRMSSSDWPWSSLVDNHNLSRIRPWTLLRWLRPSSLNHPSKPVDGISCSRN